jgi:hypothetical protein
MSSMTRGPLPAGVYWRRRVAVIGTVFLLIYAVARLFVGEEPQAAGDKAITVSAPQTTQTTPPATAAADPGAVTNEPAAQTADPGTGTAADPAADPVAEPITIPVPTPAALPAPEAPPSPLPEPTGKCSDDDIVVEPKVRDPRATQKITIAIVMRTKVTTACTWQVSPETLQVKITSGDDRIWTSVECPKAIPPREIVVRRDTDTTVNVRWSSRRSDAECSWRTKWAMPGYYHVVVAPLGGEPVDVQFQLRKPRPAAPKTTAPATPAADPAAPAADPAAPAATQPAAQPTDQPVTGGPDEPTAEPTRLVD